VGTPFVEGAEIEFEPVNRFVQRNQGETFQSESKLPQEKSHRIRYTILRINGIKTSVLTEG